MTVRSTQLGFYHSTAAFTGTVYTCPAGWRTIVKSFAAFNHSTGTTLVQAYVYHPANTAYVFFLNSQLAANTQLYQECWVVMSPGDLIQVSVAVAGIDYIMSGTLLQLTGQEPM